MPCITPGLMEALPLKTGNYSQGLHFFVHGCIWRLAAAHDGILSNTRVPLFLQHAFFLGANLPDGIYSMLACESKSMSLSLLPISLKSCPAACHSSRKLSFRLLLLHLLCYIFTTVPFSSEQADIRHSMLFLLLMPDSTQHYHISQPHVCTAF